MGTSAPAKDDRRVRRTQAALRNALVALIIERGWDGFSVQELCERADVGRSTFYMHYADKEEVLGGGLADVGREIRAQLRSSGADRPLAFARPLLEHAQEHLRSFAPWSADAAASSCGASSGIWSWTSSAGTSPIS